MKLKWEKQTEIERHAKIAPHWQNASRPEDKHRYVIRGQKRYARNCIGENAIEIEAGFHYNGSGEKAFGGAKMWPHAKLGVAFEEHQIKERDEFVTQLQAWLDDYFSK